MPVKIRGNEYNTVAERLAAIHQDHPLLSIHTKIVDETVNHITFKAKVKILAEGQSLIFSGHAREYFELENNRAINFTFALENAETSAIGRALANAGYGGHYLASAEEMQPVAPATAARQSQLEIELVPSQELLLAVEQARQQADLTVDQLKAKSAQLFGTEEIRQLTAQQLECFADQILVEGMQEA